MWDKKFYQMSLKERFDFLSLSEKSRQILENSSLDSEIANHLIENQISAIELPLGVCFINVDGKDYRVPMATEEPSVIAAANNGARIAETFRILENEHLMSGQIVFYEVQNTSKLINEIDELQADIFNMAQSSYPSIYKRGGGLIDFKCESYETWVSVDFTFDTKDAMGANMINTMLEAIANLFRNRFPDEKILFAILSNENCHCHTTVETRIPLSNIGAEIAQKIAIASDYAQIDPARAATHNKGIMNGVEAIVLATGNDSRSINAAIYARSNHKGLSSWSIENDQLIGKITLSIPIATAGGATHILPKAKVANELLNNPDAKSLASIIAAVGLANNLAALKALVGPGIQQGHMALQARSLALSVAAKGQEVDQLTEALKKAPHMNTETAQSLLDRIRKSSIH